MIKKNDVIQYIFYWTWITCIIYSQNFYKASVKYVNGVKPQVK